MVTGALTITGSDILPPWARYLLGVIGLGVGAATAFTGPVQNTASENAMAKVVIADVRASKE
jgi:hypothetical protein